MKKNHLRFYASLLFSLFLIPLVQANASEDFGTEYGLQTNLEQKDQVVSQATALHALVKLFPDYAWPDNLDWTDAHSPCQIHFLNCHVFFPQAPLAPQDFLIWWSHVQDPQATFLNPEQRYAKTWYHMRTNGWLPISRDFTRHTLQNLLYRYHASQHYAGLPFRTGMVLDLNEIQLKNYPSFKSIDEALSHLNELIFFLTQKKPSGHLEQEQLEKLKASRGQFIELRQELQQSKHPFHLVPHLPEDIRQKITENNLNEVLSQVSYNHSKDISGRRHNVVTGLMEISGKVYLPGETINYFEVLKENGLNNYAMAYNLVGGQSVWGYGGGLCGSATILFQTALKSGLFRPSDEGILRYNHSALYQNLYPPNSIGKDAVIYFYNQNLIFKNHFESPILFYAHNDTEKQEVTLFIFGNSPYEYVTLSEAEKTGNNRYRVYQTLKPYSGPEEVRHLDSYYPGGLR